jgi:O-antigen/teichoic acid export membrane protein
MIARNVVWNWAGMAIPMLSGFVLAPFLVHRLGELRYGEWILIASMTNYFGLLDLGIRGSVGRFIAYHRARGEQQGVNETLSTALSVLGTAGLIALVVTCFLPSVFFHLIDVPAEDQVACHWALLIVGLNLALTLPFNVFDATLWAYQRFDVLNGIDIPAVVARTVATFFLISQGYGLVALAMVTLATTVGASLAKAYFSFVHDPELSVHWRHIKGPALRSLYGYGIWLFAISVTRIVLGEVNPLLIGVFLGPGPVTPYSIAKRLMGYATSLLIAGTNVLTPVATTCHAQGTQETQKTMFFQGGRYCTLLALFFLTAYAFLGRPFIRLWMGPEQVSCYPLLMILAVGEVLPMSQWATFSMVVGIGRHRFIALVFLTEGILAVGLSMVLLQWYGLRGACLSLAVVGFVFRGLVQVWYGCRTMDVALETYFRKALLPPALSALLPALVLAIVSLWGEPQSWLTFLAEGSLFAAVYLGTWVVFFDHHHLRTYAFPVWKAMLGTVKS